MQQRESWSNLEAFLNVQGFQEAERIYDACDLDYAPADKKQKNLSNFTQFWKLDCYSTNWDEIHEIKKDFMCSLKCRQAQSFIFSGLEMTFFWS